jgi:hypothetical protein
MEENNYYLTLISSNNNQEYMCTHYLPNIFGCGFLTDGLEGKFDFLEDTLKKISDNYKGLKIKINTFDPHFMNHRAADYEELNMFAKNISLKFPDLNFIQDF